MGVGHGHGGTGAVDGHAGGRHRWRLQIAVVLIGGFFVVELVFGLLANSLALLSDAGHMAADVVTLTAALFATRIATRRDTTGRRTFGSYRAEIFASGFAVLVMLGVAAYIVIEAIGRFGQTVEVETGPMLLVGGIGLAINVVAMFLLRAGAGESLNVKGAYLEVVADTAGSVGVMVAGVLVMVTGAPIWDTLVAVGVGAFVVVRAVMLGRQVLAVLGQHAPADVEPSSVEANLRSLDGVTEVHDLHLWTLTSGMNVATAHLVVTDAQEMHPVLDRARDLLRREYGVSHATLQVEPPEHGGCAEVGW